MKSSAQISARLLTCLATALGALAVSFLPLYVPAAGLSGSLQASNVESVIYGDDFFKPVAALKIGRIFTDHRRLGFFRIKLLPVLVAEGVHLEFAQANPQTNWLEGFRFDPAPMPIACATQSFAGLSSPVCPAWRQPGNIITMVCCTRIYSQVVREQSNRRKSAS
jgi:hypothetical protein